MSMLVSGAEGLFLQWAEEIERRRRSEAQGGAQGLSIEEGDLFEGAPADWACNSIMGRVYALLRLFAIKCWCDRVLVDMG